MTRKTAVIEIENLAADLNMKFEEALLLSLYWLYTEAGFDEAQMEAELDNMNNDQMIEVYVKMNSYIPKEQDCATKKRSPFVS